VTLDRAQLQFIGKNYNSAIFSAITSTGSRLVSKSARSGSMPLFERHVVEHRDAAGVDAAPPKRSSSVSNIYTGTLPQPPHRFYGTRTA